MEIPKIKKDQHFEMMKVIKEGETTERYLKGETMKVEHSVIITKVNCKTTQTMMWFLS